MPNAFDPSDVIHGLAKEAEIPESLKQQVEPIDLGFLQSLAQRKTIQVDWNALAKKARPPRAVRVGGSPEFPREHAIDAGVTALKENRIAMILVAGGQGTRLGFDQPKALYPIGPVSERTLLQIFVDQIKALSGHYGKTIPLYVMTSPATHDEISRYLEAHGNFGLGPDDLKLFCQGTMPAIDLKSGKLLRSGPDQLALSPNGHGGLIDALQHAEILESAANRGIQHLFYGQIDNPLVQVCSPELIGYHLLAQSQMTTQVVQKSHPLEKVGNVVEIEGKIQIIEYSDLPEEFALKKNPDGSLFLWAGNIAVHVFAMDFLQTAAGNGDACLPYHLAIKKVPYIDERGILQQPEEPNACKFEKFIFDLLPLAENAIAVEVEKKAGFAPVKNADGAPADTPELARKAISDLHKSWLKDCGVDVADDARVEIHPGFAFDIDSLRRRSLPNVITDDVFLTPDQ